METGHAGLDLFVESIGRAIDLVGILVIVGGAAIATWYFFVGLRERRDFEELYRTYRAGLGRAILLGLEFLVAADIIRTVAVSPSFQNVGVLALIVLIRTFLSMTLELEIEGRWPWQRGDSAAAARAQAEERR